MTCQAVYRMPLLAQVIWDSLAFIMSLSISTGSFLNDWKMAESNPSVQIWQCPISLSVPSMILERHVHTTIYGYLESNNLITIHQSGFRHKN